MKSALNSISIQVIAAIALLFCAASLTTQCAAQLHLSHGQMVSSVPGVQK